MREENIIGNEKTDRRIQSGLEIPDFHIHEKKLVQKNWADDDDTPDMSDGDDD